MAQITDLCNLCCLVLFSLKFKLTILLVLFHCGHNCLSFYHLMFSLSTTWWSTSAWAKGSHISTSSSSLCFWPGNNGTSETLSSSLCVTVRHPPLQDWEVKRTSRIVSVFPWLFVADSLWWPPESPGVHTSLWSRFPSSPEGWTCLGHCPAHCHLCNVGSQSQHSHTQNCTIVTLLTGKSNGVSLVSAPVSLSYSPRL